MSVEKVVHLKIFCDTCGDSFTSYTDNVIEARKDAAGCGWTVGFAKSTLLDECLYCSQKRRHDVQP
jgi:hypothetical protein